MVRLCLGAVAVGVGYGLADSAPPEGVVAVADRLADDVGAALPDTVGDQAVDDREFLSAETSADRLAGRRGSSGGIASTVASRAFAADNGAGKGGFDLVGLV